jgi:hypothetical protein
VSKLQDLFYRRNLHLYTYVRKWVQKTLYKSKRKHPSQGTAEGKNESGGVWDAESESESTSVEEENDGDEDTDDLDPVFWCEEDGLINMWSKFLRDLLATKEDSPANRKLTPSAASTGKRVVGGSIDEYLSTGW